MIFKGSVSQAHGLKSTFAPGFGCTIADAVRASCSAYPLFRRPVLKLGSGDEVEVLDGGYCANNPTLYAIADAVRALNYPVSTLRVVSIGVGHYPDPGRWKARVLKKIPGIRLLALLLQKTLDINTTSMEQLRSILFSDISAVRINDRFDRPEMATDLMENDLKKLNQLHKQGRESFAKHETELKTLLTIPHAEERSLT
jgi:predicted acylesterase/phospholipase RssA